jgi:nitrate/nitrite-specific signal transduction histidine kinase
MTMSPLETELANALRQMLEAFSNKTDVECDVREAMARRLEAKKAARIALAKATGK